MSLRTGLGMQQIDNSIKVMADEIYDKKIWRRVHQFVHTQLRRKKNKESILHCLDTIYFRHKLKKKLPAEDELWPYCQQIINIQSPNYNERDMVKKAQQQKNVLMDWVQNGMKGV